LRQSAQPDYRRETILVAATGKRRAVPFADARGQTAGPFTGSKEEENSV